MTVFRPSHHRRPGQSSHSAVPLRWLCLLCVYFGVLACCIVNAQASHEETAVPPRIALNTDDANAWSVGVLDTETPCPVSPCTIRWEHAKFPALRADKFPTDWSGPHDAIECWIYSRTETDSSFVLIINSENPATEGQDYYSETIKLSFSGWRKFLFPLASMHVTRTPLGWGQITGVTLTAEGWGNTPNPEAVVNLAPVRLVKMSVEQGPRLTDQEFFQRLDLDYPGLEKVKAALADGDFPAAKRAFVQHLKSREMPRWHFDWRQVNAPASRNPAYDLINADKFASNLLRSCGIWHQFGAQIQWDLNPTENDYHEWTWGLSRHTFWTELGRAYWATGDEKYALAFVRQLRSWITDNPVPFGTGNAPFSCWRTIETGIRAYSSWPDAFHYFLGSPSFDKDTIFLMVKSFYEHAVHLRSYPQHDNWLCMEMNGLYHIGTLFPEFQEAAAWRGYAAARLYGEMENQVYPDGAQVELAPGYHRVALENFLGTYKLAVLNGQTLPADYIPRLEKMYEVFLKVASPSGATPAVNDSDWIDTRKTLREGFRLFPHRTDFLFWATEGREGTPPAFTSVFLPYAGWFTMRSGWLPQDLWLHFEAGPYGTGHQHEDKLSFVLHAYGARLLTEGGLYAYDSSEWRLYTLSARAHNVVRIDGLDQNRYADNRFDRTEGPIGNRWRTNDQYDFAEGIYDEGFGSGLNLKISHSRAIFFVKPKYWLLFDVFTPSDDLEHKYTSWFHFNTAQAQTVEALGGFASASPDTANLLIAPLNPEGLDARVLWGQEEPELQGWVSTEDYQHCRPVATPTFTRRKRGSFVEAYLLYPVKAGEQCPVRQIRNLGDDGFELLFEDGTRHTIQYQLGDKYLKLLEWNSFDKNEKLSSRIVVE